VSLIINTPFRKTFIAEKTFFLGCAHINHANICKGMSSWLDKSRCREYNTLDDMNYAIFSSILDNAPEDSDLFLLGDLIFGDKELLPNFLDKIKNIRLYYLYGNHSLWIRNRPDMNKLFYWVGDYLEIFVRRSNGAKKLCCLFHYPMKVWNESHHGSYAITSHSHGSLPYTETELGLDVGWDVFKKPVSFNEVDAVLSKRKNIPRDHHNEKTT
jgi:calcineurin-like phosphoesterase family protein